MTDRMPDLARSVLVPLVGAGLVAGCASGGGFQVDTGPRDGSLADRVPAGTEITGELEDRLSVRDTEEGQNFHITVDEPVERGGETAVPPGALIHGEVTEVHRSEGGDDPNVLKLHLTRIDIRGQSYPFDAELTETNPKTDSGESLAKVGGGAAAGAILGGILGDDAKDAVLGAAIGAAAGTAVALGTRDTHAVLERGSKVKLTLTEPLDLER
jgi:hypothetical protein